MRKDKSLLGFVATGLLVTLSILAPASELFAHCDALDGPVVQDATQALELGDVTPVLKWVSSDQEQEIRRVFGQILVVRGVSDEARNLADRFFFETLVRIHRAGEGAPYTGLKPAGTIEQPIMAADKALKKGSVDELADRIASAVADGIRTRFADAIVRKEHAEDSVEAGRAFVTAYVEYIHFVEGLHNFVTKGAGHSHDEDD
jgi:hypothetical protein